MRAARSRRDGLVTGDGDKRERRKGGGGARRPKSGVGGRRPGGRGRRRDDEQYDAEAVRKASGTSSGYNPFATFFKEKGEPQKEESAETEQS